MTGDGIDRFILDLRSIHPDIRLISTDAIVVADWVRLKCRYGCMPDTPRRRSNPIRRWLSSSEWCCWSDLLAEGYGCISIASQSHLNRIS